MSTIKTVDELREIASNNPELFVRELIAELKLDVRIYAGALEIRHVGSNAAVAIVAMIDSRLTDRLAAAERVAWRLRAQNEK